MSRILETALTPAQRQECEANDLRLARAMAPGLDRGRLYRVTADWFGGGFAYTMPFGGEPQARAWAMDKTRGRADAVVAVALREEPEWDRGPLTQPAELTDQAAWDAFDLERGGPGKGERLARRDDQQAAALDLQALDVIRRAGL